MKWQQEHSGHKFKSVKRRKYVVYVSLELSSVPVSSACPPLCLSRAIFSSLVNILRCCVPPRRRPLFSSFSLWRDLLDQWHFHPPFLLAPYHHLLAFLPSRPITFSFFLSDIAVPSTSLSLLSLSYLWQKHKDPKSLTVVASLNRAASLNVPEPASIQPEESFHLPPYTPEVSILAMEINSHLSTILK